MNKTNVLNHIAIIMDGNGRWANKYNKERKEGHKAGAKIVSDITKEIAKLKIPYVTLYAFSTENWNRPKVEIDFLMHLLIAYLQKEECSYIENGIRFNYIGDISKFNKKLQQKLMYLKDKTKRYTNLTQTLALNYGSQDELSRTFIKLLQHFLIESKNASSKIKLLKTHIKKYIEENLDTANMPPVDILIRTGGEKRLSNFLLWQSSYAELFFTETLWPDFSTIELNTIITEFLHRNRKFGGL